jgi:hypothetical protein
MTDKIIPVPDSLKHNLTGRKFGRLSVLGYVGRNRFDHAQWLCRCECGNETVKTTSSLVSGRTVACGCYNASRTHGKAGTTEYQTWSAMIQRCTTPGHKAYPDYGGRGIKVCGRWRHSFENFYNDMGPRPGKKYSLDRIDNDGDYEPSNCRWTTQLEQMNNRRMNHRLTFNGENLTINQWAAKLGINSTAIHRRIALGWPVERILTEPVAYGRRPKGHAASKAK